MTERHVAYFLFTWAIIVALAIPLYLGMDDIHNMLKAGSDACQVTK